MQAWVIQMMNSFGYGGIFLLILIENLFPPIPSEVILTFGGFMTTYTDMQVPFVVLFSTLGSVAGAIILYFAGRLIPRGKLEKLVDGPVGRCLHFEKEDIGDAMEWFEKKGRVAVLLCRCVPIVRSLISIPAGMAGMGMGSFLALTTIGSLIWNVVLVSAGAAAGASWEKILKTMSAYSDVTLMVVGVAAFVGCTIYYGRRGKECDEKD